MTKYYAVVLKIFQRIILVALNSCVFQWQVDIGAIWHCFIVFYLPKYFKYKIVLGWDLFKSYLITSFHMLPSFKIENY